MTHISLLPSRSILNRIADVFHKPVGIAPTNTQEEYSSTPSLNKDDRSEQLTLPKSKLQVSVDDLKVISTALLHYKRNLSLKGELEKAQGVGSIDQKFYELIQNLEAIQVNNELVA